MNQSGAENSVVEKSVLVSRIFLNCLQRIMYDMEFVGSERTFKNLETAVLFDESAFMSGYMLEDCDFCPTKKYRLLPGATNGFYY